MAYAAQPRNKDHWSLRLRVKRPGGVRPAALVVAGVQTLLLAATASSFATDGGLYGCASACGSAAEPAAPLLAVLFGIAILVAPMVIGALCEDWRVAVPLAVLPVFPALLLAGRALLTPSSTILPPTAAVPYSTTHFGSPFWLDPTRLTPLLFALVLFALLGWLGWVIGSFFRGA